MSLTLSIPSDRFAPLRWVAEVVFRDMLAVPVEIAEGAQAQVVLAAEGRRLVMPSLFPDLGADRSLWRRAIPSLPLADWDVSASLQETDLEAPLPVLFGEPLVEQGGQEIRCGVDILGSVFFMLSRFEEVALDDRDNHDRFPAVASLAWGGGFLYRPIVDEYVEALWALMKRLWPGMQRKRRDGRVRVSCDVDQPFDRVGSSAPALVRSVGGDLLRRRSPSIAWRRIRNFFAHRRGDFQFDPYYTFDWYMDVCERGGHRAAFYFISDHSGGAIDGSYTLEEPRIIGLIQKIARRGHEIGMHGSYNTFRDVRQIARERARLTAACEKAGIEAAPAGNRQHYLRWDTVETPEHLEAAGFSYDTTGSFADRPGFRYGTSHPFPMWSWKTNAPLRVEQRPLVLMECSVTAKAYLGLGHSQEALALMLELRRKALKYGGDFTLLWHNSELLTQQDRMFFEQLLS